MNGEGKEMVRDFKKKVSYVIQETRKVNELGKNIYINVINSQHSCKFFSSDIYLHGYRLRASEKQNLCSVGFVR